MAKKHNTDNNNTEPKQWPKRIQPSAATHLPGKNQQNSNENIGDVISDAVAAALGVTFGPVFLGDKGKNITNFKNLQSAFKSNAKIKNSIFSSLLYDIREIKNQLKSAYHSSADNVINPKQEQFNEKVIAKLSAIANAVAGEAIVGQASNTKSSVDIKINADDNAGKFLESVSNLDLEEKVKANIKALAEITDKDGTFTKLIDNIAELSKRSGDLKDYDENVVKRIVGINEQLEELDKVEGKQFKGLQKSQENLKTAVEGFDKKDIQRIELSIKGWVKMSIAVAIAAGTLLLGAKVMEYIDTENLLLFTGYLTLFLLSVAGTSLLIGKYSKDAAPALNSAMDLVVTASFIMFIGQMVAPLINIANLIFFTATLGMFLFTISGILGMVLKMLTVHSKQIKSQTKILGIPIKTEYEGGDEENPAKPLIWPALSLVMGSTFIMLIGSMVMPLIKLKNLLLFTATLGIFLFTTYTIVALISRMMKSESEVKEINGDNIKRTHTNGTGPLSAAMKLVIGSAFLMFVGSLVVDLIKPGKLLKFTMYLGGFLLAIGTVLTITKIGWDAGVKGKEAMKMVTIASMLMMIGSLVVDKIPIGNLLKFTGMLSLFLLGIGVALRIGAKGWQQNYKNALGMAGVVAICSAILVGAGMIFHEHPGLDRDVAIFGTTLVLFIGAMGTVAALLSKFQKQINAGVILMGEISIIANIAGVALLEIALAARIVGGNTKQLWITFGVMMSIVGGLATLCGVIGIPPIAAAVELGVLVMAQIALVAQSLSLTMLTLAFAMDKMSNVKQFDVKPLIANIESIIAVMWKLAPIGAMSWLIVPAELTIMGMCGVLSLISNTVKDYAELKIPIYAGKRVIGYRQLQQSDFTQAARNVGLLVTILSKAIIDATKQHPEYFAFGRFSKLAMASRALESLGPLVSKIARAVKNYSVLRIPISWDKDGNATGYHHLQDQDFNNAGENVKRIITVLSGAIVDVYNKSPQLYTNGNLLKDMLIDNPFVRVIKSNMQLAKLITRIASAVKTFASGRIPTRWDKEGKAIAFESLGEKHFKLAETNIIGAITTLGGAIVKIASDKQTSDLYGSAWGNFLGVDNKFTRVVKANIQLAKLISKIGSAVQMFASSKIATKWDSKTGKAIAFEKMDKSHFNFAQAQIIYIMSTLGNAVVKQANDTKTKDLYGSAWGNFMGVDNKFTRVVNANMLLAKMVTQIGHAVKNFADMKIATEYKDGRAVNYKQLRKSDFTNAASSIEQVINTLAGAIYNEYTNNKKQYDDDDDSPIKKVINVTKDIGKIVSEIAEAMKHYSDLKIPIYGRDGKIKTYKQLTNDDFINAGENISKILSTLTGTMLAIYETGGYVYDVTTGQFTTKRDKNIYDKKNKDNPLFNVIEVCTGVSELVGDVAKGVKAMSELKFVDTDKKHFTLKNTDIQNAGKNAMMIVTTIIDELIKLASGDKKQYFIAGEIKTNDNLWSTSYEQGNSEIKMVIDSVMNIGQLISGIAEGVRQLANMTVAGPNGKPVRLTNTDFTNAAKNVSTIITTIVSALMDTYKDHQDWFKHYEITDFESDGFDVAWGLFKVGKGKKTHESEKSPFQEVIDTNVMLGQLISSVANAVVIFAQGFVAGKDGKPMKIDDSTFTTAATAIEKILTATGSAIVNVSKNSEFANTQSPALKTAVDSITQVSGVVTNVAEAISILASGQIPTKYNNEGQVIESKPIDATTISSAATAIDTILTSIGNAIYNTVSAHPDIFTVEELPEIQYVNGQKSYEKKTQGDASKTKAAVAAYSISQMAGMIGEIADAIVKIGSGVVPEIDADGKPTGKYTQINIGNAVTKLQEAINDIVTGIGTAIGSVVDKHPEMLMDSKVSYKEWSIFGKQSHSAEVTKSTAQDASRTPFMIAATAISNLMGLVGEITDAVMNMATMRMPVYVKGQLDHYDKITQPEIDKAIGNIVTVVGSIVGAFIGISEREDFKSFIENDTSMKITDSVKNIFSVIGDVTQNMITFTENIKDPEEYVKKMIMIVYGFNESVRALSTLLTMNADETQNVAVNASSLSNVMTENDTSSMLLSMTQNYAEALKVLINAIQQSEDLTTNEYDTLAKGINTITEATNNIQSTENFKQQADILDKFVKTVNTVRINNIDRLTRFVDSMNLLAYQMGNLDKFTSALSEKLSKVLEDLTRRLEHAEKTIVNADKLQKARHELINKSVAEISKLMNKSLQVEVYQTMNGSSPGGSPGASPAPGGSTPSSQTMTNTPSTAQSASLNSSNNPQNRGSNSSAKRQLSMSSTALGEYTTTTLSELFDKQGRLKNSAKDTKIVTK